VCIYNFRAKYALKSAGRATANLKIWHAQDFFSDALFHFPTISARKNYALQMKGRYDRFSVCITGHSFHYTARPGMH
jgi:hypothetical protein